VEPHGSDLVFLSPDAGCGLYGDWASDKGETFEWLYDKYDGLDCYRIEIKCGGNASGIVWFNKVFGYIDGEITWMGWGNHWGQCKNSFHDGLYFNDVKQHVAKCEFEDGSKVEVQIQPAEWKHCPPKYE
jgi:hypothetical protein